MNNLIKKLVEAYGPSGFEDGMRDLIRPEIEPYVDDVSVDKMGNLIAIKHGDGTGVKVMLAAHMDEIGVMATHITKEGFVRFTNIGGVFPHTLMGSRVQFENGTIGVVHVDSMTDWVKVHPLNKHYIDVGATSKEDCPIAVGDAAGFVADFIADGNRLVSKAMDDRIGCVVAIEAMKRLQNTPHEVYCVFSVQEEVGVRGAMAAANGIAPDVGIALDITTAKDVPESGQPVVNLNGGAAIKVKDAGMIAHTGLVKLMKLRAENAGIPYQFEVLERGGTDARSMQTAGAGSAAGCISIPCRYAHTRSETVDARDVEHCIQLLVEILQNPIEL
jgi:endoglucanase